MMNSTMNIHISVYHINITKNISNQFKLYFNENCKEKYNSPHHAYYYDVGQVS